MSSPSPIWGRPYADTALVRAQRQWLSFLERLRTARDPREPLCPVRLSAAPFSGLVAGDSLRVKQLGGSLLGLKNNAAQCFARATQFAVSRLGPAFQRIGLDGFKTFPRERAVRLCTSEPC